MQKTITIEDEEVTLATTTVQAVEDLDLAGKKGRAFNVAFVAAAILAAGDTERGNEKWVKSKQFYSPIPKEQSSFTKLLDAANEVNGFTTPKLGEIEPEAPAIETAAA